jgi:hypothetical protein
MNEARGCAPETEAEHERIPVLTQRAMPARKVSVANDASLDDTEIEAIVERVIADITPQLREILAAAIEAHFGARETRPD